MSYGGIEAGGTKWVCAIDDGPGKLSETLTLPTTTPAETIANAAAFFSRSNGLAGIGVGSVGPIDLRRSAPTWGSITTTPNPGWAHTDVVSALSAALGLPVALDTGVNAAPLGGPLWGAAVGLGTL